MSRLETLVKASQLPGSLREPAKLGHVYRLLSTFGEYPLWSCRIRRESIVAVYPVSTMREPAPPWSNDSLQYRAQGH